MQLHAEQGLHLEHIWQNTEDPNEVQFIFLADDLEKAKAFINKMHNEALQQDPKANLPQMTYLEEKFPKKNPVGWFEIPVNDMERAIKFYETVLNIKLERHQMGPLDMAWFPAAPGWLGSMGTLVKHTDFYKPSHDGVLIYFTAFSGDVSNELGKVEAAGGKVLMPKKQISPEYGYMGLFEDSEGNRIALHCRKG